MGELNLIVKEILDAEGPFLSEYHKLERESYLLEECSSEELEDIASQSNVNIYE